MTNEGKPGSDELDPQDDNALWNLLGRQAPPVKVSPYFARRVLREVALVEDRHRGWPAWLRRLRLPMPRHAAAWSGAFAFGVLCLSAVLTLPVDRPPLAPSSTRAPAARDYPLPAPETALADQDVETIADLDNLLDREESRLWTEDSDTARF